MISKPTLTVPPWADTGDVIQPDPTYIASGFPHTNDKPTRQTMNWVLNYATNGVQYLTARGIPDWDAAQTYTAGDVVRFQGKFYSALQSNNTNRQPATQTSWWALWYVFQADLNTLYITPAQVAASYLTTNQANATFTTAANLTAATKILQDQINAITAVTGTGYRAGNGISIDTNNFISFNPQTANLPSPDWNATSGGGQILNKPTFATVATSGSYNDLSNRPALAPVATSGDYNSLTNLPPLAAVATSGDYNSLTNRPTIPAAQVQSDWNGSGIAAILNKPPLTVVGGTVMVNAALAPSQGLYVESATQGTYLNFIVHDGVNPYIQSSTGVIDAHDRLNMLGAPSINFARQDNPAMNITLAGGTNSVIDINHPEICDIHLGAEIKNGAPTGYLWCSSGIFSIDNTSLEVYGDNLSIVGNFFRVWRGSDTGMYLEIDVRGGNPVFNSNTGAIVSNANWSMWEIDVGNLMVNASSGGSGYFQICNNGQFGNPDPWMWSSTGRIRCYVAFEMQSDLYVDGGVAVSGGMTVNQGVSVGSLTTHGDIRCDNNHVYAAGYQGRAGISGGFEGQAFNFYWSPPYLQVWVDATHIADIVQTSDYRLKENINLLSSALPLVMRLRPVTFNWRDIPEDLWRSDKILHAGFLAHEVQDVFWGAADGKKDERTADGKIQPQHLNQIDIVALLTRAVQELSEKVSFLENKMNDIHRR